MLVAYNLKIVERVEKAWMHNFNLNFIDFVDYMG